MPENLEIIDGAWQFFVKKELAASRRRLTRSGEHVFGIWAGKEEVTAPPSAVESWYTALLT